MDAINHESSRSLSVFGEYPTTLDARNIVIRERFYETGDENDIEELYFCIYKDRVLKKEKGFWSRQFEQKNKIIALAFDNDLLASHYAIVETRNSGVFLSLDTMTHPDYRKRGLFFDLATMVYEKAKKSNIDVVYGFPNKNSFHALSKRLNWIFPDDFLFELEIEKRNDNLKNSETVSVSNIKTKNFKEYVHILCYDSFIDQEKVEQIFACNKTATKCSLWTNNKLYVEHLMTLGFKIKKKIDFGFISFTNNLDILKMDIQMCWSDVY